MSFDPGSNTLRFAFCWPPSIGASTSEVTSFDWALAGARSCPSIGQRQQQVVSFDWGLAPVRFCPSIRGLAPVRFCPSIGLEVSVWRSLLILPCCLLRLEVESSEGMSFDWTWFASWLSLSFDLEKDGRSQKLRFLFHVSCFFHFKH